MLIINFFRFISFNTANSFNMTYMLSQCSSLTSLNLINFNTQNVNNISFMFFNCSSLSSLDLTFLIHLKY